MSIPFHFILRHHALCCCRPIHGNMNSRMDPANGDTVMESHLAPQVARMDYNMRYAAANLMDRTSGRWRGILVQFSMTICSFVAPLQVQARLLAGLQGHQIALPDFVGTKDVGKNAISAQPCRFKCVGPVLACRRAGRRGVGPRNVKHRRRLRGLPRLQLLLTVMTMLWPSACPSQHVVLKN